MDHEIILEAIKRLDGNLHDFKHNWKFRLQLWLQSLTMQARSFEYVDRKPVEYSSRDAYTRISGYITFDGQVYITKIKRWRAF